MNCFTLDYNLCNASALSPQHTKGYSTKHMKVYFCPECGAYDFGADTVFCDCEEPIPSDGWSDMTEEELAELDYIEEFELPPGLPSWEYEVVRIKTTSEDDRLDYTLHMLNSMGDRGWELVNIVPLGSNAAINYGVFKRAWIEDI